MKGILTVMGFTFRERARRKSFIISTAIIILLSVAAICVPAIINAVKSSSHQTGPTKVSTTVYVIDSQNIISADLTDFKTAFPGYDFVQKQPADEKSLSEKVKDNSGYNLMVLSLKDGVPTYDYYVKSSGDGPDTEQLSLAVKTVYGSNLLKQGNVPVQLINKVNANVNCSYSVLGRDTVGGLVAGYAVIFILFFSIYMYGIWVAMSIASEKTSRVMEVLITSTKPSKIVIGKSIGMGLLGLCQILGMLAIDALTYRVVYSHNITIGGTAISISNFTPFALIMLIVYFIFGFSLYAMMDAVAGATVSKSEDVQQAIMPISLIAVLSFYLSFYSSMYSPDSTASIAASIIPFSAPFAMPARFLNGSVSAWQIVASIVLLAATTVLMGFISIKLYSSAVLHYGKRLKISELIRMSRGH
jgi:ABC-2 type transport system permease protein